MLDTNDEWIVTRTGMKRRHIAASDEHTSDLAIAAARDTLKKANLEASDVDCFIVATSTPDYLFPATACLVAAALGAVGKPAFDMEIACAGFVYGLSVAAGLVGSGIFRRVMIIGAEKLSHITDMTDRGTAILFADGAGAVIVERSERDNFLACELGADGREPELLYIPAGGTRRAIDAAGIDERAHCIRMQGREIYKYAVTKMVESTNIALNQAGLTADDCAYFIPHQANLRIIELVAKQLRLPLERVLINIAEYGNTSAASIPITLSEAVADGRIKDQDVLAFSGFGGGLSWGTIIWKWEA
jgi:3-oxoacyl-[acyl-carrier-protein] synthase-3